MAVPLRGDQYYLYRGTASLPGGFSSETWNACPTIQGLSDSQWNRTSLESKVRGATAKGTVLGKLEIGFTVTFEDIHDDADLLAFIAAADAGTPLHMAIADGPIATTGTVYRHAVFVITEWTKPEPDNEIVVHTFKFECYDPYTYAPAKVTVA